MYRYIYIYIYISYMCCALLSLSLLLTLGSGGSNQVKRELEYRIPRLHSPVNSWRLLEIFGDSVRTNNINLGIRGKPVSPVCSRRSPYKTGARTPYSSTLLPTHPWCLEEQNQSAAPLRPAPSVLGRRERRSLVVIYLVG